jgi:glycosyltransferase involved in cell wall biosynthesis
MNGRLKVLVSAYACSPYRGSEAAVGWGYVEALAKMHDLWVVVEEEKFRADIERYLRENPGALPSVRFFFIAKKRNRLLRKVWPPSYYHYYRLWHEEALELARSLHAEVGFDIAHQLTMVGFREPGYLWKLDVPFVWGPVGGMGLFPWRFLGSVGAYGAAYFLGYNLYNVAQMRLQGRPRRAARAAASGLIAATDENRAGAARYWGCPSTSLAEVGLPSVTASAPTPRAPGEPLRIVWTGIHAPRKALNLGLEALARLPSDLRWELHVIGKGERTGAWIALAERLGIRDRCTFHGWLERSAAMEVMAGAHAMLITSLRDLTATVTIEALALGLPIVCLDHCGFGSVVDASCGIKVAVETPGRAVEGLAAALERLVRDEPLRRQLGEGAVARSKDFAWDVKARAVDRVYRQRLRDREQQAA